MIVYITDGKRQVRGTVAGFAISPPQVCEERWRLRRLPGLRPRSGPDIKGSIPYFLGRKTGRAC